MTFELPSISLAGIEAFAKSVSLEIDGERFENWTSVSIEQGLEQIAGSFNLSVSNKLSDIQPIIPGQEGNFVKSFGIYLGASCKVKLGSTSLIDGYIDDIVISYSANDYSIGYSGRDKTADLVDCCYDIDSGKNEFKNQTAYNIISKLCAPFGITVRFDDSTVEAMMKDVSAAITSTSINIGAPVYDKIVELCRVYAVMPYTKGDGVLWIGRASAERVKDSLEGGINVLSMELNMSNADRFKTYHAKAAIAKNSELAISKIKSGPFLDNTIDRHRTLILLSSDLKTIEDCKKRAEWEMRVRAGKSRKLDVTVQGWTQSDGSVWPLNKLVPVFDPYVGVDADYLITGLTFSLGSGGTLTNLSLTPPKAFELIGKDLQKGDIGNDFWENVKDKLKSNIPSNIKVP